jgi:hypothetical protein
MLNEMPDSQALTSWASESVFQMATLEKSAAEAKTQTRVKTRSI